MEYRVIIDGNSPLATKHVCVARTLLEATRMEEAEGVAPMKHPVLHCSQVDWSHPALLRAHIPLGEECGVTTFWIPYEHVLGILEVAQTDARQAEDGDEKVAEPWSESGDLAARPQLH